MYCACWHDLDPIQRSRSRSLSFWSYYHNQPSVLSSMTKWRRREKEKSAIFWKFRSWVTFISHLDFLGWRQAEHLVTECFTSIISQDPGTTGSPRFIWNRATKLTHFWLDSCSNAMQVHKRSKLKQQFPVVIQRGQQWQRKLMNTAWL